MGIGAEVAARERTLGGSAADGRCGTIGDAELLAAARRGERAAFGALVERYQGAVCAVTYSRTRDAALSEDVAQDTFLAAWRQLDALREPRRLGAWLCGIAKNLATKARRRTRNETPLDARDFAASDSPFDALSQGQTERIVGDAIARVPETYRDVLVLYYREGFAAKDVAHALGISEAAVLQRLARGRDYLADGLASLVETSLRARRPRRNLVAGVLAAIAMTAPTRVEASTKGSSMLKLAALVGAITAAGTTAYVVHARTDATPAVVTTAPTAPAEAPAAAPAPPAQKLVAPPATRFRIPPALPATPELAAAEDLVDAPTAARLRLYDGPSRGPADAPIRIAVFTDLLCSFCGDALGPLDDLVDAYPGQLRLVVKQMPVHEAAKLPAEAALAAEAQGQFWPMHDAMLAHQEDLSREALVALATEQGLDVARFTAALDAHTYAPGVAADQEAARELDIQGTPAFVINGKVVVGLLPTDLRAAIDDALAER